MTEPLIFQGTSDQLEAAGDCAVLLYAAAEKAVNRRFGIGFGVICGLLMVYAFWKGDGDSLFYLIALIALGVVSWRRVTGREAMRTIASRRRDREKYRAKGKYDGNTPFRIELGQGECRFFVRDVQPQEAIDCRLFHNAVECGEVIWLSGWATASVTLPKKLLTRGTEEELRAWLKPYVKKWKTVEIPPAWSEKLSKLQQ